MKDKNYSVEFGSYKVTFYPLLAKHIRTMPEEMQALVGVRKGDDPWQPERYAKLLKLWLASARRGDPNVTEEAVETVVDMRNLLCVNRALLGQDWEEELSSSAKSNGVDTAAEVPESAPTSPLIGGDSTRV